MIRPLQPRSRSNDGSVLIVVMVVCLALVSLVLIFGGSMLTAWRGKENALAGHQADAAICGAARYAEVLFTNVDREGGMPENFESENISIGEARVWFIAEPGDPPVFGLTDEASKLNLNTATREMLMQLPGMTENIANAVINWRYNGQTADIQATVVTEGPVKRAPFESVDELALVVSGTDQELIAPWRDHLTVFSREPVEGRVNVTQPNALTPLLTQQFGEARANEITAQLRNQNINSVLAFYIRGRLTPQELDAIGPQLTAVSGSFAPGLVNANTAGTTVLACIPGIGAVKADQLVKARQSQSTAAKNLAWVVPILGEADALTAGPHLTANAYQLSVDAAAVGRHGRGYRRARFVIDKTTDTPKLIYRRNLAPLGWALGDEVRQQLAEPEE